MIHKLQDTAVFNEVNIYVLSYMNKCKDTKFDFQIPYPTDLITLMNILAYWSSQGERSGPIFLQLYFGPIIITIFLASETTFSTTQCVKNQPLPHHWGRGVPWCLSFIIFTYTNIAFTLTLRFVNLHFCHILGDFAPNPHTSQLETHIFSHPIQIFSLPIRPVPPPPHHWYYRQLASFHVLTVIAVAIPNVGLFYQYPRQESISGKKC